MRRHCFSKTITTIMLALLRTSNAAFVPLPATMRRAITKITGASMHGAAGLCGVGHSNGSKLASPSVDVLRKQRFSFSFLTAFHSPGRNGLGLHENQHTSKSNYPSNNAMRLFSSAASMEEDINKLAKRKKSSKKNKKEKSVLRVDRILSNRGVGSRSETHRLIKDKRISTYDAEKQQHVLVTGPSVRLPADVTLYIDRTHELPGPIPKVLVFHKPKYVLSETTDRNEDLQSQKRKHVNMYLDPRYQHKKAGLHPVGRLDYDSSGLLLFSSDGALTQRLLHPRHEVEKEYVATVEGMDVGDLEREETKLRTMLEEGIETTEGVHTATLLEVVPLEEEKVTESINDEEENDSSASKKEMLTNVRLIVQEGKYRMVRRMLANCGYPVIELKRIRQGMVTLDDGLEAGQFREATGEELAWLNSLLD